MRLPLPMKEWSARPVIAALVLVAFVITGCGQQQIAGVGTGGTGAYPMGGAIQGKPLSLNNKVTTIAGSTTTAAGTSTSADGIGPAAGFDRPEGITSDGTNLYVTDYYKHTVRKIMIATGAVTTLAGSPGIPGFTDGTGSAARFNYPYGITNDGVNLYVADSSTIRKITIDTGEVTTLAGSTGQGSADGPGATARFTGPGGIITDGTNLYVTDNNTIRKIIISSGEVSTIAGAAGVSGSTDGIGTAARFRYPEYITTDGTALYVTDSGNLTVRKIVIATGVVSTLAGTPEESSEFRDGIGSAARFYFPNGITSDGTNLYVTDFSPMIGGCIRKIEILTGAVTTISLTETSRQGIVSLMGPRGIITDGNNLYVADAGNRTIREIALSSGMIATLAGSPPFSDGIGTTATFNVPYGISTDGAALYIADQQESTIRKMDLATGAVSTLAGKPRWTGSTDGVGAAARFNAPTGVTTDGKNVFVTDMIANVVRKIHISTGRVTTLAGSPWTPGLVDGTGAASRLNGPYGITTDGKYLYVTEGPNNAIRKVEISTGAVTTLVRTVGFPWTADPDGLGNGFVDRLGITTDGVYLYVADGGAIRKVEISTGIATTLVDDGIFAGWISGLTTDGTNLYATETKGTVRKVVISTGEVTTVAGTPGSVGSSDGTGSEATFNDPTGVTTDGTFLYIADTGNSIIRRIE